MRVTDRYPHGSWRGPKPTWRTRPRKYTGPLGPVITRQITNGATGAKNGNVTTYHPGIAALRQRFTRFTTTPDWAGNRGAHAGAHSLLSERN